MSVAIGEIADVIGGISDFWKNKERRFLSADSGRAGVGYLVQRRRLESACPWDRPVVRFFRIPLRRLSTLR